MKRYNIVYITTNSITGKKYIGSHETDNLEDGYIGSGQYLKKSIKKYGKSIFIREILEDCNTIDNARKLEEYFIQKYNTLYPDGYNISITGGMGNYGGTHSDHTKEKLRKAHTGKKRIFSEKHKKNLSIANKKWHREIGMSEITKEKISLNRKGIKISEEARENYKKGNKGKNIGVKHKKIECEYCHKMVSIGNHTKWHGKKCKLYEQ